LKKEEGSGEKTASTKNALKKKKEKKRREKVTLRPLVPA
jgi:hypothetical protein